MGGLSLLAQEPARTAQSVRDAVENQPLAALEVYAAQTRAAVYRGFELLDEQRAVFALQRTDERAVEVAREPLIPSSTAVRAQSDFAEAQPQWHYDSLQKALAARSPSEENQPRAKDEQRPLLQELEIER